MFRSELELGNFLGSTDVISKACDALLKIYSEDPKFDFPVEAKHHDNPTGFDVLAFVCSPDHNTRFLHGEDNDLVSSQKFEVVDFICTKKNPSFSINRAAVNLYEPLSGELSAVEDQLIKKPLVITGHGLGGYVATLFALWLHNIIDEKELDGSNKTKRPICITFGSPLVGDDAFLQAISERPRWKSCFLNVVLNMDPMPRLLLSTDDKKYKPFGAYLFCTESGGFSCFEEKQSILGVLDAVNSSSVGDVEMEVYGKVLIRLKNNVLYEETSELGEFDFSSLRAGITLQLLEIGVLTIQEVISKNILVGEIEAKAKQAGYKNVYEPTKKLNDMKISSIYVEWYMKVCASKGGYYDNYKKNAGTSKEIISQQAIAENHVILNQYWKSFVENKLRTPQKEGANLRKRWLYSGTTYRKMFEPLDIAEFYRNGPRSTDYMTQRSPHYKLLEKWFDEDKKLENQPKEKRNKAGGALSEDSCFWARVEEALLSLKNLENTMTREIEEQKLMDFEKYVMDSINEYSLSTYVFSEGSSFIKWWGEYEKYKGSSYDSEFVRYMKKGSYKLYR